MKPEYTLEIKSCGEKKNKDRLTVLFCCNADGSDKQIPLVIGKSKKPGCFNGVKQLPPANSSAWMNADIFDGSGKSYVIAHIKFRDIQFCVI